MTPEWEYRQRPHPQISHTVWPNGSIADTAEQACGVAVAQACVEAWEKAS